MQEMAWRFRFALHFICLSDFGGGGYYLMNESLERGGDVFVPTFYENERDAGTKTSPPLSPAD